MNEALFIGLISGTSRDGVDAALVNIRDERIELLHALCNPYPPAITRDLDALLASPAEPVAAKTATLDDHLARFFALTARELVAQAGMQPHDIRAIGSHGQTVWHQPAGPRPRSIQLGKGDLIARHTGITTVSDFRTADIRAGGQGAPLAPLLHRRLFYSPDENRVILNIGGIANITHLHADGSVSGFDCGPGNCLMDAWIRHVSGQRYDKSGAWAASGQVHEDLLASLLTDPYFDLPAPKSTGIEYFNLAWLESRIGALDIPAPDLQCTLTELTAASIVRSLEGSLPDRLLVCGGGVHNAYLLFRLGRLLPDTVVESTLKQGTDPDWVEAVLFAWLASERLAERPQDTRTITGAQTPALLGRIHLTNRERIGQLT